MSRASYGSSLWQWRPRKAPWGPRDSRDVQRCLTASNFTIACPSPESDQIHYTHTADWLVQTRLFTYIQPHTHISPDAAGAVGSLRRKVRKGFYTSCSRCCRCRKTPAASREKVVREEPRHPLNWDSLVRKWQKLNERDIRVLRPFRLLLLRISLREQMDGLSSIALRWEQQRPKSSDSEHELDRALVILCWYATGTCRGRLVLEKAKAAAGQRAISRNGLVLWIVNVAKPTRKAFIHWEWVFYAYASISKAIVQMQIYTEWIKNNPDRTMMMLFGGADPRLSKAACSGGDFSSDNVWIQLIKRSTG